MGRVPFFGYTGSLSILKKEFTTGRFYRNPALAGQRSRKGRNEMIQN
jgi:hypothetical protein